MTWEFAVLEGAVAKVEEIKKLDKLIKDIQMFAERCADGNVVTAIDIVLADLDKPKPKQKSSTMFIADIFRDLDSFCGARDTQEQEKPVYDGMKYHEGLEIGTTLHILQVLLRDKTRRRDALLADLRKIGFIV